MTLSIMVVTMILSDRGTNGLGDFEVQYQYEPHAVAAIEKYVDLSLYFFRIFLQQNTALYIFRLLLLVMLLSHCCKP